MVARPHRQQKQQTPLYITSGTQMHIKTISDTYAEVNGGFIQGCTQKALFEVRGQSGTISFVSEEWHHVIIDMWLYV